MRRVSALLVLTLSALLTGLLAVSEAQLGFFSSSTTFPKANAAAGTTVGLLAKITATGVTTALTTDTTVPLYLVGGGEGTAGTAILVLAGPSQCVMDATVASGLAGAFLVASSTTAGRCHAQPAPPSSGYVIGFLLDDATLAGGLGNVLIIPQPFFPAAGAGSGSVTSVGLGMPAEWIVSGSPVTTAGAFTVTKATQAPNLVYAGPPTGGVAVPTFRALVAADLPGGGAGPSGAAGGSLGGTYPNPTVVNAPGAFALTGDITPTPLAGNVNDYSPTGFATASVLRIDGGTADRIISGLGTGSDGDLKLLQNVGTTNALLLPNQSPLSSAAGRFVLGGDMTLLPAETVAILYDATVQRWRAGTGGVLDSAKIRPCQLVLGSMSSSASPLANDEDSPSLCANSYGRDWQITTVACKANAGAPTIQPTLTGGTATSILTSDCTCGTAWTACAVNGAPIVHSFSGTGATCSTAPCDLSVAVTTAGGIATYLSITITGRLR